MQKAIIMGAGTYGQVYAEYLKAEYNVIGYIDDNENLVGNTINGIKVLGNRNFLFQNIDKNTAVFVPIGNNDIRVKLLQNLHNAGFSTPSFIHPHTQIHDSVKIGKAVYVLPATNIMPFTTIDNYVMVSIGANIAHHNHINEGCFFSHGVNIGAFVTIGEKAYVSAAATVILKVKVGKNALIGAGAVVIKDVPDNAVMAGVPAKILKYKENC